MILNRRTARSNGAKGQTISLSHLQNFFVLSSPSLIFVVEKRNFWKSKQIGLFRLERAWL